MITINEGKAKAMRNQKAQAERAIAFRSEHDTLLGKWARGEVTQEELIAKATEIRARFPYED